MTDTRTPRGLLQAAFRETDWASPGMYSALAATPSGAELLRRAEAPDAQRYAERYHEALTAIAQVMNGLMDWGITPDTALASPPAGTAERCGAYGQDHSQGCPASDTYPLDGAK